MRVDVEEADVELVRLSDDVLGTWMGVSGIIAMGATSAVGGAGGRMLTSPPGTTATCSSL